MSVSDKPDLVPSDDSAVVARIRRLDHAFPFAAAERVFARIYTIAVFRRRFAHLGTGTFVSRPLVVGHIPIGRNACFGDGAVVAGTVVIGDHAAIGAHSDVTRSVPALTVVAGAPVRLVRQYDPATSPLTRARPRGGEPDEQVVQERI